MPGVYPFKALRPKEDLASTVSANTLGSETDKELISMLEENPFSYLHIVKPHLHFGGEPKNPSKHFQLAKQYVSQMESQGIVSRDEEASFYIYRQENTQGESFEGFIALADYEDYLNGKIKKHENTRTQKEENLVQHIGITKVVGQPVLLSYSDDTVLSELLSKGKSTGEHIYDFNTDDELHHEVWKVSDPDLCYRISLSFSDIDELYIADGHHRSAASAKYLQMTETDKSQNRGFMSFLISEKQLKIVAFHRLFKGITQEEKTKLHNLLQRDFEITKQDEPFEPAMPHVFGMYFEGNWYRLKYNKSVEDLSLVDRLDVNVLESAILKPILHVEDSKSDARLEYLEGTKGLEVLQSFVDDDAFDIAFTLYPCSMAEVKEVADQSQTMPPKSTWVEPKLRTGLIIQKL